MGPEASGSVSELGDEASIDLIGLFRTSWVDMVRLATFLIGSQTAAEDLVQDTFERLAVRDVDAAAPVRYLRASVVNACRSYRRRRLVEFRHRPSGTFCAEDHPRELLDVLGRLSMRQRTAVVLRYYADLPESEIADILHCRPGTVRSLVQRALLELKKELST
jgi:RNA polymerase sigma factor (sigma-70 family)